jgi:hypothetical protein
MIRPLRLYAILAASIMMAATALSAQSIRATSRPAPVSETVRKLEADAKLIEPLVETHWVKSFLRAANNLPSISARSVFVDPTTKQFISHRAYLALPKAEGEKYRRMEMTDENYYYTKYGSPLAYARPLDLVGQHGLKDIRGARILDYGYGTIGHLRLLASIGVLTVGVDVDSFLPALYCEPTDVGSIRGIHGDSGFITLLTGRFPADKKVPDEVGKDYDLIISKNTLKNGYLHPEREVDKRMLIDLGVKEDEFVRELFNRLKPGGRVMIYNICPAPAPADKPYIPWADGRSPFTREQWEKAGFRVVIFDQDDSKAARAQGHALGWDQGEDPMNLEKDIFALYTYVEKPAIGER